MIVSINVKIYLRKNGFQGGLVELKAYKRNEKAAEYPTFLFGEGP
jgi:hypothetical protein